MTGQTVYAYVADGAVVLLFTVDELTPTEELLKTCELEVGVFPWPQNAPRCVTAWVGGEGAPDSGFDAQIVWTEGSDRPVIGKPDQGQGVSLLLVFDTDTDTDPDRSQMIEHIRLFTGSSTFTRVFGWRSTKCVVKGL